jgi:MRG
MPGPKFSLQEHTFLGDGASCEEAVVLERRTRVQGSSGARVFFYKVRGLRESSAVRWVHEKTLSKREGEKLSAAKRGGKYSSPAVPEFVREILQEDAKTVQSMQTPPPFVLGMDSIIRLFAEHLLKSKTSSHEEVREVEQGFRDLILFSLERCCLYGCEREHFVRYVRPGGPEAVLRSYGYVHLFRVLVSFPRVKDDLGIDSEVAKFVADYVYMLFGFIAKNLDAFGHR